MELTIPKLTKIVMGVRIEVNSVFHEAKNYSSVIKRELEKGNLIIGNGQPILILPGFITGDWAVRFLKKQLTKYGYSAHTWELGINHGMFKDLEPSLSEMIDYLYELYGVPVILVGWSKGARISLKIAKKIRSTKVAGIITLGGPIRPDGRYSRNDIPPMINPFRKWVHNIVGELQTPAPLPPKDIPTTVITFGLDQLVSRKASEVPKRYLRKNLKNVFIKDCGHVAGGISAYTVVAITQHIMRDLKQYDRSHGTHIALAS
jgi:predicted esterase